MDVCPVCQTEFKTHYRSRGIKQIYCSKHCKYKSANEICVCKTCKKQYTRNKLSTKSKEYCSVSCTQRNPCQYCGKIIMGRKTFQSEPKRFCGRRCAAIFNKTLNAKQNYVVRGFVATIKRVGQLKCERCGFDNPFGLAVHHMDRNKNNNNLYNLETLCGTCHMLEHWKGSQKRTRDVDAARFISSHYPEET